MPATVTLEGLQAAVAAALGGQTPEPFWADIARDALRMARDDVYAILGGRGYTTAQIDAADNLYSVVERQAIFWGGHDQRAMLTTDAAPSLDKFDMRPQLAAMALTTTGVIVVPGGGLVGAAAGGFAYPASGTARNPLLTDPVPRRCGDTPFPSY